MRILPALVLFLLTASQLSARTAFYVAPDGADSNPGSQEAPFASMQRARDAVRATLASGRQDDIHVWLREGTYRLTETLVFDRRDGAIAEGQQIVYSAIASHAPVLSAAVPLPNPWKRVPDSRTRIPASSQGNVWVTDVPESWHAMRSLFDDQGPLPRARSRGYRQRNKPPTATSLKIDRTHLYLPEEAVRDIADFTDAEMVVVPEHPWVVNILPMTQVDRTSGLVVTDVPATYNLAQPTFAHFPKGTLWIENVFEALDQPGEWVLDVSSNKLYLWPRDGKTPDARIVAPRLTEMIRVEGDIHHEAQDSPVRGLTFQGLTFTQSDRWPWEPEKSGRGVQHDWEMHDRPTAMLRFRGAEDCQVRNCRFVDSAAAGVRLDLHCQRIELNRCEIAHVGGVGVLMAGYGMGTKDVHRNNVVSDCHIHHVGRLLWHAPGVFVWQSGHNRIEHNRIHHTAYSGIVVSGRTSLDRTGQGECSRTVRWAEVDKLLGKQPPTWENREPLMHGRNNLVAFNDLHHCMEILGDGNAIYISGTGDKNLVLNNFIHDIPSANINANIRCDDDQHGVTIQNNVITRCCGEGFIFKGNNTIRNNIVYQLRDKAPDGTSCAHQRGYLVLPSSPVAGSIVQRNLFVSAVKGQLVLTERGTPWKKRGREMPPSTLRSCQADYNLYFNHVSPGWGQRHLDTQRAFGIEQHSIEADPMFMDPANDDFRLADESPARKLGFEEIDLGTVGDRHLP